MTESEWMSCREPGRMIEVLQGREDLDTGPKGYVVQTPHRKLRLWVEALRKIARGNWTTLTDAEVLKAVQHWCDPYDRLQYWAGSQAPSAATRANLLRDIVWNPFRPAPTLHYSTGLHDHVWDIASVAYDETRPDGTIDPFHLGVLSDALEEAGCVGPCAICGGSRVRIKGVELARTASSSGTPGNVIFNIVTDDCDCPGNKMTHPVIEHLRSPGPHYRGMWSLDIALGWK